jgi:ABC-2 type transport system permease protein
VLFCITLARLVTTSLAGLLRSRRGKDLAAFLIIPIFALYEFFTQVVPKEAADGKFSTASFVGIDSWLRWLPPGLAAHAIQDASDAHPGTALLRLALLAAVIVALGWLWIRSLSRALVTADTTTQSSRVHSTALPLARYSLRGAVIARVWIYQRREPASLVFWAMTAVIMAAVSARALLGPDGHPAFVLGLYARVRVVAVVLGHCVRLQHCDGGGQLAVAYLHGQLGDRRDRRYLKRRSARDLGLGRGHILIAEVRE